MSDAPEVYQALPQGTPDAAHTGPYYGGPRPESEGLQVQSAYAENHNNKPYSDNPAITQQQQPYGGPPQQQYGVPPQYGSPPQQYGSPPQQYGSPPQQYVNPPLGHQTMYAENGPQGFLQTVQPYEPPADEKGRKKQICGLSVLVFWCLIGAAFLIVVGAVVGGVVGSQKAKDSGGAGSSAGGDKVGESSVSSGVTPTATTTPTSTGTTGTTSGTPSATSRFDEKMFYRLSNQYLGAGWSIGIDNTTSTKAVPKVNMTSSSDSDGGQFWQIKKVPDADERYWFACQQLGKDVRLFLDPSDRINPLMAEADDTVTGQQWSLKSMLDGTWRISNALGVVGAQLSTYSDTHELFMDMKDDTGIQWSIAEVKEIETADGFTR